jgi:hypothetical protein
MPIPHTNPTPSFTNIGKSEFLKLKFTAVSVHIGLSFRQRRGLIGVLDAYPDPPDPDWHAFDADLDPDLAERCGDDPILIRIHNTDFEDMSQAHLLVFSFVGFRRFQFPALHLVPTVPMYM